MSSRRILWATITASLAFALSCGAAAATEPSETSGPAAVSPPNGVFLEARPLEDGAWQLQARVVDASGQPIGGQDVLFTVAVDFLGSRNIVLGSAQTDVAGKATLRYRPTWNGLHALAAQAVDADGTVSVTGQSSIQVDGVDPPVARDPQSLPTMRAWAVPVAALVVAAVWLLLGFLFVAAVIGVRRSRGAPPHNVSPGQSINHLRGAP